MGGASYKDAGVDLETYGESMSRLPRLLARTHSPRVIQAEGGFAGLFQLDFAEKLFARNYRNPVLVSGTDGVGTKLKVASLVGQHDTVGIDLVAMCVNDILCCGAEPLFFLDYVAVPQDDPDQLEQIVAGISEGCRRADTALIAGETAILPDLYQQGDYDLAGFCVGVIDRDRLIAGNQIEAGDIVLGIPSSGIHSNGFSLVRKIVFEMASLSPDDAVSFSDQSVGELLLTPTKIYTDVVAALVGPSRRGEEDHGVHGIAHITGGGLAENLARILPGDVDARVEASTWETPPVFPWLQQLGQVADDEMWRVFNMGVGLVLVVDSDQAEAVCGRLDEIGEDYVRIGHVMPGSGEVVLS